MQHALISPSAAPVWRYCPASILMAQAYPEPDTDASKAGTASHWAVGLLIGPLKDDDPPTLCVGDADPDGTILDMEMIDGAYLFANDFSAAVSTATCPRSGTEQRVNCSVIHALSFGTTDAWLYDETAHRLIIWEYKYGFIRVEPFENWQLICYYAGLLKYLDIVHDQDLIVELRVVQPRAPHRLGPIRTWTTTGAELRPYVNQLHTAAADAMVSRPEAITGSHCKYCSGRHACDAALIAGVTLYEAAVVALPAELSPEQLGRQLSFVRRALEHVKSLEAAYSERVRSSIKDRRVVPGWVMAPTTGRENWIKPDEEVKQLGAAYATELTKTTLITPNQARSAGIPDDVLKRYAERTKSGFVLEPETEKDVERLLL